MAPIRRYLRITKYSVLEVRIYLSKPSDIAWLLSSRDPVLPRIIQEVRPKVLPKLREENENAKKKGSKKKKRGIKDVASQDDFEVSIFLKETSTRHSLLTKQKSAGDKPRLQSTGNKLTSWMNTKADPITITDDAPDPVILQEEDDAGDMIELANIPPATTTTNKRKTPDPDDDDALFVSSSDEETFATQRAAPRKRRRVGVAQESGEGRPDIVGEDDDKKKLALNTSYDGFSIYGRILCLIVTRKGQRNAPSVTNAGADAPALGGSQMMEQWVSTQAAQENAILDDDEH